MTISVGDTVGPYQIIAALGQGGMATVFKAYHPALDRYVAIKVLHAAFKEDANFNARFIREARIVAKLDHPNIVPIYDFAEHQGISYLVMRFIEGRTLKAILREGPLPIPRVLAIIRPVTDALAYAHAQGILHRDIKPSNILLANDGHIFLADFGLARIVQASDSTLSKDMLIGTPQYISPEQARGEPATERSDLYSLGVVLFEMLTGRVPFSADTPYAIIHDHIYTPLPLPTSINPSLSPEIERLLLKALAKDPQARYASATEMMTALEHAAAIEATQGTRPSTLSVPVSLMPQPPPTPEPSGVATATPSPPVAPVLPTDSAAALTPKKSTRFKVIVAVVTLLVAFLVCGGVAFALGQRTALSRMLGVVTDPVSVAKTKAALNPQDPQAHLSLANEYVKQKNFEAAFAEYNQAIKLAPRNVHAYIEAGRLALRLDDLKRASEYVAQGLALAPDNVELLMMQGDLYLEAKRYADALATYERILELDAKNPQVLWRLGNVRRLQGEMADALRYYSRALVIDPNLPEAHYGLGILMMEQGNKEEASRRFRIVINNPNTPPDLRREAQKYLDTLGK
jgi:serine/threonine-protein kinase